MIRIQGTKKLQSQKIRILSTVQGNIFHKKIIPPNNNLFIVNPTHFPNKTIRGYIKINFGWLHFIHNKEPHLSVLIKKRVAQSVRAPWDIEIRGPLIRMSSFRLILPFMIELYSWWIDLCMQQPARWVTQSTHSINILRNLIIAQAQCFTEFRGRKTRLEMTKLLWLINMISKQNVI